MASYDIGDKITLRASFTDSDAAVDPSTVTCAVRAPDGTPSAPSVSKAATGVYTATVLPDAAGVWFYRFAGTGAYVAAEEGTFLIRRRRVT